MNHRSHEPWTSSEESDLSHRFRAGASPSAIANAIGRSELAIRARLAKLGLLPALTTEQIAELSSARSTGSDVDADRSAVVILTFAGDSAQDHPIPNSTTIPSVDVQQAFRRFHFVYGIVNPRGQVYIGYSGDVWHRIAQHNKDVGAVVTRNNGPWFPFAIYCFAAAADARALETSLRRNFSEFAMRTSISLKEVLAQIGIPLTPSQLSLL